MYIKIKKEEENEVNCNSGSDLRNTDRPCWYRALLNESYINLWRTA